MNMKIKQIKNFFDEEDYKLICSLPLKKKINDNSIAVYHNRISKDDHVVSELINDETLRNFQKKY